MNLLTRSNIIIALLAIVIVMLCFYKCGSTQVTIDNSGLKKAINNDKLTKDSIRERIVYKDRVKTEYVIKWRNFKGKVDSIPCPEALNEAIILTDSIIVVDSSLVASLKAELLIDSLIIKNQDSLIIQDSVKIAALNKEIKKHKRQKKFIILAGLTGWILAAIK